MADVNNRFLPFDVVRVGAFDVDILEWGAYEACAGGKFGEWSNVEQVIRVDVGLKPMKLVDTLLHEINHAVFWAYCIYDEDKEERVVGILSAAWTQIYRDNPCFLSWVQSVMSDLEVC